MWLRARRVTTGVEYVVLNHEAVERMPSIILSHAKADRGSYYRDNCGWVIVIGELNSNVYSLFE